MNAINTSITTDATQAISERTTLTIGGIDRLTGLVLGETKNRSSNKQAAIKFLVRATQAKGIDTDKLSGVIFAEDQESAEMNLEAAMNPPIEPEAQEEAKPSKGGSGRNSCFKGYQLWVKGSNPRVKDTRAWHSMNIIIENPGIQFEEFKAKGGNTRDLLHDFRRDRIAIKLAE